MKNVVVVGGFGEGFDKGAEKGGDFVHGFSISGKVMAV